MLDDRGKVILVNPSWQRASGELLPGSPLRAGMSYLQRCARGVAQFGDAAREAAAGIAAVLQGERPDFCLEYARASSPHSFRLTATSLHESGGGVLLLQTDVTHARLADEHTRRLAHDLGERVKEQRALYQIARLLREDLPVETVLSRLVALLPPAMQFPEITAARVRVGEHTAETPGYRVSPSRLAAEFATSDGLGGLIDVVYLEERPAADEGAFLAEERYLVDSLADLLRMYVERQLTRDALVETASRLRAIVESEPICVKLVSIDGRLLDMNPAGLRMVGVDAFSSVCGRAVVDLIHPDDRDAFTTLHQRASAGQTGQLQFRLAHGQERWVESYSTPLREADGRISSVLSVTRDITEQRRAQAALVDSQHQLQSILDSVGEGIHGLDRDGRVVFTNPAAIAMFGWQAQEMLGQDSHALIHHHGVAGEEYHVAHCPIHQTLRDGIVRRVDDEVFFRKDGTSFPVEYVCAALRDVHGGITGAVVSFRDVSDQRRTAAALRASEARLRTAQRMAHLGNWEYNLDSGELLWSDEVYAICGVTPAVFTPSYEAFIDFVHPEDRPRVRALIEPALDDGATIDVEHRVITRNGALRYVHERGTVVRDSAGRRAVGTIQDITQLKQVEQSLRASEQRFKLLAKTTNDAIWDWDLGSNALWWNEGFELLFGYDRQDVEPTIESWTSRVHPHDKDAVVRNVQTAISGGADSWSGEYRFRRRDGSFAYVLDRGHVIRDASGAAIRMVGGMTDLTQHKQLEERLSEQAALLDAAHDAIYVVDMTDQIVFWSEGAVRAYGFSRDVALGRQSLALLHENRAEFATARETLRQRHEWQGEMRMRAAGGRTLVMQVRWTLVCDSRGEPKSILAINTDVTERKTLEAQIMRAQRLESIGTLAGGIAHDLNNVLAPIMMSIELLREDTREASNHELLDTLQSSAQRGAELIKQLLAFARGKEGTREPLDIRRVVADIQKIVLDTFPKDIRLRVTSSDDLWPVIGDPTQLDQVVMNLVLNARDAMPNGGELGVFVDNQTLDEVYVRMNPEGKAGVYVRIRVEDNGVGIPRELQPQIFDPFFTTKEVGKGTGLGLSTVATIVKSHGGFVSVSSEPGVGTSFSVYLPAAIDCEYGATAVPVAPPKRGRGELILVIDDEDGVRAVCRATLERHGYRVVVASNGAEAVSLFAARPADFALVITDMAMPIMDGHATAVALRTIHPAVKIIGSTGHAAVGGVPRVWIADVRDIISKPYTADTLLSTVAEALREE